MGDDGGGGIVAPRSNSDRGGVVPDHTTLTASTLQRMVLVVNRFPDEVVVDATPYVAPEPGDAAAAPQTPVRVFNGSSWIVRYEQRSLCVRG